jgi:hypothetical protein
MYASLECVPTICTTHNQRVCVCLSPQPRIAYTDRPRSDKNILRRCFPTLGSGLASGDTGIRGDVLHLISNHTDTFASGHSRATHASQDLAASLKVGAGT